MTTAATTTATSRQPGPDAPVVRYNRRSRWFHAATYVLVIALLFTGWWLRLGREGRPSALARALDLSDVEIHRRAGWAFLGLGALGLTLGIRATVTFVRETARVDRGDGRWFLRWPAGALTGRLALHRGHFDPGQRIANVVFVVTLGVLTASGLALTTLKGGSTFALMVKVHRYTTYALTPVVVGHVLLALGILPGYRGAWRSMHWGGRVPRDTARRLWPASAEVEPGASRSVSEPASDRRRTQQASVRGRFGGSNGRDPAGSSGDRA